MSWVKKRLKSKMFITLHTSSVSSNEKKNIQRFSFIVPFANSIKFFSFQTNCGVANLVDRYLGHLYPEYLEHTRPVLIRQARDLLVCTFHGDLTKFEEEFLAPAANIIDEAKRSCCDLKTVSC